jgi:hypothetical protein
MNYLQLLDALPEPETASLLGVEVGTLRNWRAKDAGPPYARIGNVVLYPVPGLRQYVADNVVIPRPVAPSLTELPSKRGPGRPRKQAVPA